MESEREYKFPNTVEAVVAVEGILEHYREDRWSQAAEMIAAVIDNGGEESLRNALIFYLDTVMSFAAVQAGTDTKELRRVIRDTILQHRLAD